MNIPVLDAENLSISFSGLRAVDGFSVSLSEGEMCGLIGPNGAGKTTVFNLLTGVYRSETGHILLDGKSMLGKPIHETAASGIARTFQNIRLFRSLSVSDNIKAAHCKNMSYSMTDCLFRLKRYRDDERLADSLVSRTLREFGFEDKKDVPAGELPYGEQRRLEIARAISLGAKVLLLDEPAAGMNNTETLELMELISHIREKYKTAVLLIEHDMSLVMKICRRIIVLDYGKIIAEGTPSEIQNNKEVLAAYLGED